MLNSTPTHDKNSTGSMRYRLMRLILDIIVIITIIVIMWRIVKTVSLLSESTQGEAKRQNYPRKMSFFRSRESLTAPD